MTVLGIYRARWFSPNSVENDRMIMELVMDEFRSRGDDVYELAEEDLINRGEAPEADIIFTMARSKEALRLLDGHRCINTPEGIRICNDRSRLDRIIRDNGIPCPPPDGTDGIWLKRGDETAMVAEDTVFCKDEEAVEEAMRLFHDRGITNVVRQAHIPGDLVKFYSVAATEFFYYFYPTDSGRSKFGSEKHNGKAHHYAFSVEALKSAVDRIAALTGIYVYGGDAIIRPDGSFAVIDFNDWPTFSPCRQPAAKAIVETHPGPPRPSLGREMV